MRTGAARAVCAKRHNEKDVTMTIAGLSRYGDWRHEAMGCTALVPKELRFARVNEGSHSFTCHVPHVFHNMRNETYLPLLPIRRASAHLGRFAYSFLVPRR